MILAIASVRLRFSSFEESVGVVLLAGAVVKDSLRRVEQALLPHVVKSEWNFFSAASIRHRHARLNASKRDAELLRGGPLGTLSLPARAKSSRNSSLMIPEEN